MAIKPSDTFNFAYSLTRSGGNYTLVDSDGGSAGVNPFAVGIKVVDKDGSGSASDSDPKIRVASVAAGGQPQGAYRFVATATIGGAEGYIVKHAGEFYFLTDTAYGGNLNGNHGRLQNVDTEGTMPLCFLAGTLIATTDGQVTIEALSVGQMAKTSDGRFAPVRWVGRQTVSRLFAGESKLPVRVRAGALGDNVPSRDLLLSPHHALLVEGLLVNAGALVNGISIVREYDVAESFVYYTVELDEHSLILAENTPAETFLDNVDREHFDNWDEHEALYPEGKTVTEMALPRAKAYRQVSKSIRERLDARAAALLIEVAA